MSGDEGDFFFDQAEVEAGLGEDGQARLEELEGRLQLPTADEFQEMVAEGGDERQADDADRQAGEAGQNGAGKLEDEAQTGAS